MNLIPKVEKQKDKLRKEAFTRRAQLATEYDASLTRIGTGLARFAPSLIDRFCPTIVAGYWGVRSEIDILPLLSALQDKGIHLCLPITGLAGTPLSFHHWTFGTRWTLAALASNSPSRCPTTLPRCDLRAVTGF